MSAIKTAFDEAVDHLRAAAAKLEEIGHDGWERVKEIVGELEADEPKLADEAKTDAEQVVATAETQGLVPAEQEAVADGEALIVDAGQDVAAAVEGSAKTADAPAQDAAEAATAEQAGA